MLYSLILIATTFHGISATNAGQNYTLDECNNEGRRQVYGYYVKGDQNPSKKSYRYAPNGDRREVTYDDKRENYFVEGNFSSWSCVLNKN